MGGAAERAAGRAGAVARPGGGVPLQDAAGGAHVAPHAAAPPLAAAGALCYGGVHCFVNAHSCS